MADVSDRSGEDDVVLTGLSGRLPESDNIEEFARQLFAGEDLVTADGRRWTPGLYGLPERCGKLKDLAHFDAMFFGVHAKQAQFMDPQLRLLLEVTHEAIVDAGLNPVELRGSRTGVYVGGSNSDTSQLLKADINGYTLTGCTSSMFPNRVSYTFDLKGPSLAIDTGCSSSMVALVQAANAIRTGQCDGAIVAGANLCLRPHGSLSLHRLRMLSPEGRCAAFDSSASGYVRSEAVVAVLLQRQRNARRLYCTVRGARANNDGYKEQGITYPSGAMQSRLAVETFEEARLNPADVAYVEAHGTGTEVGDPEEVNAIAELFCKNRQTPLLLGSVKSNMGHSEPVCGLCSIAKVVVAMESGVIPGNLHFKSPNNNIPALSDGRIKVVDQNTPWQGGLVVLNSFGFGGANAHVILESRGGARPPSAEYPAPRLVLASGRTPEAVEQLLKLAAKHQRDAELHALIDAVHSRAIRGHPHRGYAVLDPSRDAPPVINILESDSEPRPVWFIFSGMGSQCPGVGRTLLRLPAFAASVARSVATLEPYGVDVVHLITEAPVVAFDNAINSFVSIAAVQIALVDVFYELGVRPDGMIGSSFGEIGCAYADGALSAEQALLCAYWRGRSVVEAKLAPGAMAVVGVPWEKIKGRCPADVECVCIHFIDNILIAGSPASIDKVAAELAADGVFTKRVDSAGVAFHSKLVADAGPLLHASLLQVIPKPKPRSARWLSTSVPQDQWNSDLGKLCDAAYFVNNLLSPVQFSTVMAMVPERALVVEVAPQALMQALLRGALPSAKHVPLLRREAPDALSYLLSAVGQAYAAGVQPQVSRLYPSVSWPVSRGTPALASHVGWDHSMEWSVAQFSDCSTSDKVIEYDLGKPEDAYIAGYEIDGRILFPAAGYLNLVWRTLANMNNLKMEETAVVLEHVKFRQATVMTSDVPVQFFISLLGGTGEFEISESGIVVVTGVARLADDANVERLSIEVLGEIDETPDNIPQLEAEDIYKQFRLRGLNYNGVFRGIKSSNVLGTRGLINWNHNWISFMDSLIQYVYIGDTICDHRLPVSLQRVVIDPVAQRSATIQGGAVPINVCRSVDVVTSGGVEIRGLKRSIVTRLSDAQTTPRLEKCIFIPLLEARLESEDTERSKVDALAAALQLTIENCGVLKLNLTELVLQMSSEAPLLSYAVPLLQTEPHVYVAATLVAGADAPHYVAAMEPLGIKVSHEDAASGGLAPNCHVVLCRDALARQDMLDAMAAASSVRGSVVLEERVGALDDAAAQALVRRAGLVLVSRVRISSCEYLLLRRAITLPTARVLLEVPEDDEYSWVEPLKTAMKRAESEDVRVYVWSRAPDSGLLGLATCLRREPGGDRLRFYYLPGAENAFEPDAPEYRDQVQRDLVINVLRAGVWGTFRHLLLDDTASDIQQVEHAYVNTLRRGDLSSLRWIESDLRHAAATQRTGTDLCRVYYAPLNFRDVMIATGKLPPDALPIHLSGQECILGLEFSGRSSAGKRVMGMVEAKGLATTVLANECFMWDVPSQWSLEEAATVPVAYATAYYALALRGRMRRGESVLVHAGAGGVGQAAITIALHTGCTVFTTVGTPDKRAFLREHFPQLPDANIGNSRDCSFERLVLRRTCGRGVDLVLNSLAGDKLQASLRCLAVGGRFLEIGKLDLSNDSSLGMAVLLKNTTVYGIQLDALFNGDHPDKAEVVRCVTEGIASGVVRPLPATVYTDSQLEQAFRYMATGKHIGKVLIRVREEEASSAPAPTRLVSATPRTYMHPAKSYVLVGGLGGFGLELGSWLASRGARTLVFNSRSGVRTGYQAWCIWRWRSAGVRVLVSTTDATTAAGARALLEEAAAAAPVGGVFNLAAVMRVGYLENLTPEDFFTSAKPKINATGALDVASRELAPELDYFVAFSSVASGRGERGMSAYGLANSTMERLCERRRADGLPALAVQWGAIADVGLIINYYGLKDPRVGSTKPQRITSCLEILDALLSSRHTVTASMVVEKRRSKDQLPQDLMSTVANILGIKDVSKVAPTATLVELGLDSLMTTEIKMTLERSFDVFLSERETRMLKLWALSGVTTADKQWACTCTAHT